MPCKKLLSAILVFAGISAQASDKDIRIPTLLWEKIEQTSGEIKDGTLSFFPIKVIFKEKTEGLVQRDFHEITLPRGGGEIDLAKVLKKEQGTFSVSFELEGLEMPEDLQVYFVSQSRKRRIDGDIWGAGCRKFLDIKSFYLSTIAKEGLSVNTTRNRHLTVLGGNFVFVIKNGKQVLLSQVTFTDSSEPNLFCGFQGEE